MSNNREFLSKAFVIACALYVTCLQLSNLIASKIIIILNISLPAAVIVFPITYVLGDIFTEVYGFRRNKLVIWIGFVCNLFSIIVYIVTIILPYPDFWDDQNAFITVFSTTPRILISSSLGYLLGGFSNSVILSKMKVAMQGKKLYIRTVISTIVGEAIDTLIFVCISFFGTIEIKIIFQMFIFQYLWKVCYEIVLTPVTCFVIKWLKTKENVDVFDKDIKYHFLKVNIDTGKANA